MQYGALIPNNCPSGASCGGNDVRLGVAAHIELFPDDPWNPWLGIGVGREWLTASGTQGASGSATTSLRGWEYADLIVGVYHGEGSTRFGPFVSFSFGEFERLRLSTSVGGASSYEIPSTAMHHWLVLGLGGTYDL